MPDRPGDKRAGASGHELAADAVSDGPLILGFVLAGATSVGASWVLVISLERVGARLRLSEALLGVLAALAGDAPEITTAVTALIRHDGNVGAGVVIGSNVFNIAALIGLAAIIAGRIGLHRRVIELGGVVALWIALVALAVVTAAVAPAIGLLLALAVIVPYVTILAVRHERLARLRLPASWTGWLVDAVSEEELELEPAIHPRPGTGRDGVMAASAVLVVVGASIAMERTATRLGSEHDIPGIVVGGLVLAAVTSLPNAVAAVYLAMRGRGAATLSTALNSNAFNVIAGLLVPVTILGFAGQSPQATFVTVFYVGMTVLALALAYLGRGLSRAAGILIVLAYIAFAALLIAGA
ncbi:MAG TPA: hypothetical protein VMB51_05005 [Solirubrobacteraceae bacterium]|nr:hypothetical protein [Solirubrobacteraceae bacterium]